MNEKVFAGLWQRQNHECFKEKTTEGVSHLPVKWQQRPWVGWISLKIPEPPHAPFLSESVLLFPGEQLSGTRMFEWENTVPIPLGDRRDWGGSRTTWRGRALPQTYCGFQGGDRRALDKQGPTSAYSPVQLHRGPGRRVIPVQVSCLIRSQGGDRVAQSGWSDKKQIFLSWSFKRCHWFGTKCRFTFKITDNLWFLKFQIGRSSPRFFITEIVRLGLSMPLILTEQLIRHDKMLVLILHDFFQATHVLTGVGINLLKQQGIFKGVSSCTTALHTRVKPEI